MCGICVPGRYSRSSEQRKRKLSCWKRKAWHVHMEHDPCSGVCVRLWGNSIRLRGVENRQKDNLLRQARSSRSWLPNEQMKRCVIHSCVVPLDRCPVPCSSLLDELLCKPLVA